jgi:aspartyl-tRNA(Asn)/glutamyl-tRNA(Gln) amidotransferase subunit A
MDLRKATAAAIGRGLQAGALDAVDVSEFFLERIVAYSDPTVFTTVTSDRAREEARAAASRLKQGNSRGPLDGVPIAWKDLFDMADTVTSSGSALRRHGPAANEDAAAVAHGVAAGMVALGKVNLPEFAFSGLGLNPHFGTPINPHDAKTPRAPGGSSSGSGVCVAAGLAPVSIGTDTGGSVRVPACFNGLIGYKSSEGHIGKRGLAALSPTLDTIGPLAHSVEDCVLLERVMRGRAPTLMAAAAASHVTLVVPNNVVFDGAEEAVSANFEAAIECLARAGMRVRREAVPLLDDALNLTEQHGLLAGAEAWHVLRDVLEGPDYKKMDIRIWHDLTLAKALTADDVLSLHEGYERMRSGVAVLLGSDALLAMPTTKNTAPPIADLEADWEEYAAQNWLALGNTNLGNILGVAALTLPDGTNANNMPTGFMVCAPGGHDERLLAQGLAIEAVLNN